MLFYCAYTAQLASVQQLRNAHFAQKNNLQLFSRDIWLKRYDFILYYF